MTRVRQTRLPDTQPVGGIVNGVNDFRDIGNQKPSDRVGTTGVANAGVESQQWLPDGSAATSGELQLDRHGFGEVHRAVKCFRGGGEIEVEAGVDFLPSLHLAVPVR